MDLIYMNAEREDIGVLQNYELDLAFGSDENSFECVVEKNNHCCNFGFYLYVEGTEYGGIIDSVEIKNSKQEIVYCGRTWHGVLNSKVLEPDSGADYLVCSGEANAVISGLVSRMGLSGLFVVSEEDSGLEIKSYKMNRYISGYDGIMKMLKTVDGKLQLRVQNNGQVLLSAVPVVDYTTDGLDSDLIDLDVKRTANTVNHLICLGQGNLSERLVVHLYVDKDGNISRTQTISGVDEYVAVYDYSSAEDEADLVSNATEHLKELMQQDDLSVDVNDVDDPFDVGDLVGATDNITGMNITVPIKKKIVTIKNGIVTIAIKPETSNVSTHTSEGSSGGSSGSSGEAGADGKDGKDGVSCTHQWNGTVLTVTSASGTSSADLKGEPGKNGADGSPGKDGYTPVKGVDYFDGQDGKDGADGSPGKDGYTPVKGVDYFDGQDGKDGADGSPGKDGYTPVKGVDYFDGKDGADGSPGKDGYTPQKGIDYFDGKDGVSGVYVGSGDMPDGYNVQIDPDGEGESLQDMIDAALQEAKDSGEFKGDKGDPGSPGKNGQDGTVSFDELTDAQKSQLIEGIVDDLAEEVQADLVSTAKISPSSVFASYAEMLSCGTFSLDSLKVFTVIEKNIQAAGNYYGGHTFIGLYKDASNYLKLWTSGYNLTLTNVVSGKTTSTTITSIQSTVTPCSDVCTVIDFVRQKLELRGLNNGTMTLIVDVDLNTLDLSALDSFQLLCGAGKYSGYQANIYARINDYFDYPSLMNQPLYMSNYNSLPVVSGEKVVYEATGLTLGGTITNTISATHKISNATMTADNYFAMQSTNSTIGSKTNVSLVTHFKVTSMSDDTTFGMGAGASQATIIDEDGNLVWNGKGRFVPEVNKWYYLTTTVVNGVNYGSSYGMRAIGTFTIEAEALFIAAPSSINMCAETWNGQFFTGALPFKGTNVSFTSVDSFAYTLTGKFIPVMAPNVDAAGNIRMYNGTKWIIIGNA